MDTDPSTRRRPKAVQDILHQLQTQALAADSHRKRPGDIELRGVMTTSTPRSSQVRAPETQNRSFSSQSAIDSLDRAAGATLPPPFCPWWAISTDHHRFRGLPAGLHAGRQLATQGMQWLSAPLSRKLPISTRLLRQLRSRRNFDQAYDRVLWWAVAMGNFYMLRRSEYFFDRGVTKPYAIHIRDVTFRTTSGDQGISKDQATSVTMRCRGSMTDQVGVETTRTLERSGSRWLYPVLAVKITCARAAEGAQYQRRAIDRLE
ncbi:LOW QUALITY PROTEIN: Hypothetical protein PHPALM_37305 [Phytophthora palmivora]|uniref:Uncharacterized protein n=1 Tax=Phytophthora palmivora TaxID=4796 RepID=A0A2P4WXR6_9STRA|nr:LOW QUALITY PROTEIN: Hypothetical protein PHPALM_37305 [Phytophthora palmivora]